MSLLIDRSRRPAPISDEDLRRWAGTQSVFISSEMGALRTERRALADRLRELGFDVVIFEDLGGATTTRRPPTSTAWRAATLPRSRRRPLWHDAAVRPLAHA